MQTIVAANLTEAGTARVQQWLDNIGRPGLNAARVCIEVCDRLVEQGPNGAPYELGQRYTTTGRPELLELQPGDYELEYAQEEE